ncbi:MAG: Dihydrolipoyllysine-residue acetyltransferase component of pyruvate dehydrogenase complex [Ignavibacteriaceae bacterium]|nr:Dihydrolipoyllysine-residue acetyltransferase component of pyruvate dehydrogenase complex [Ignavibacteriaceae bacterium]
MRSEIIMPKMGESVTEGTIIKWHKKLGDFVKRDEIIFEISTDKVDTEIPSQDEGYITQIFFGEGETIEVGKVVAILESEPGASVPAPAQKPVEIKEPAQEVKPSVPEVNTPAAPSAVIAQPAMTGGIDITMPKMGESVMEGTIIKWHKKVGDSVKKDEIIFEISTDKVDTEVPSPSEGIVSEILVSEQTTVPVGTVVARLGGNGSAATSAPAAQTSAPASSMHDMIAQAVTSQPPVSQTPPQIQASQKPGLSNRFYSPLVLTIARTENISMGELENISGSGLGGRVTKNDVLNYLKNRTAGVVTKPASVTPVQQYTAPVQQTITQTSSAASAFANFSTSLPAEAFESIPMDNIRQKIMQHMVHSRDTSVHVTGLVEVDMTKIANFLAAEKENVLKQYGAKLTYMAFISQAVVKVLQQFPLINASIDNNTIIRKRDINLGIAVALEPNGLIVPNIKRTGEKNLIGIAKSIAEMAEKARTKKLSPDDISGGTFTITNYGVFGTLFGTPIINQPELAILGVGAVVKRPVVIEHDGTEMIAVRSMMYLTLSHDHRLVDGMLGGRFLKAVKDHLENFNGNLTS